ncbi:MAG TPA: hypothetical protein VF395_18165 [Polyangiaceae bacterium]
MRFKQPGFPTCLAELGYLVQTIGVTITLADGTKVVPDVMASRHDPDLTLLVEVKSGQEMDGAQLARMLQVTAADLRDFAHLPVRDVQAHRVAIVYLCNEEHRESFAEVAARRGATILGFDGARFRTSGAALADTDLATCLARAEVDHGAIPLDLIPFDRESPEEEVARAVIPHIVEAMILGTGRISADLIVSKTHHLVRSAMESTGSGSELAEIVSRAKGVLERLATGELAEWMERIQKQPQWRFRKALPADATRTRELQRLQRAAEKYLEALGTGRAVQLELLDVINGAAPESADE